MTRCVIADTLASKRGGKRKHVLLVTDLTDQELAYLQTVLECGMETYGYDHAEVDMAEDITSAIERRLE